ncbi:right-handed parallel beta-helix repeat-containing protein [Rhodococcus qingshengii]|uniref:right-handed parallel beta-helix repeat-containing protein n=1 Tax=Rhodococcus qingshengii TaxID=334542 RepID=UPI0014560FD1|nr:right-handed parallel beta-helix repeat-containing protein [Rhodococcus qingshengii]
MTARPRLRAATAAAVAIAAAVGAVAGVAFLARGTSLLSDQRTYYVSAGGDDRSDGRSPARAWRTLDRASAQTVRPGDQIRLAGGEHFTGQLRLDSDDAGDPTHPVILGSYGPGRAVVDMTDEPAVSVHNTSGVSIGDLTIVGTAGSSPVDGITVYNDLPERTRLVGVRIERVEVSGAKNGIAVGSAAESLGFDDVSVRDSSLHDNAIAGLATYGPGFDSDAPVYAHRNVTISGVSAYRNTGDPAATVNTGNGIILGSVEAGRIERSTAYGNGALSAAAEGPVGIWAYDSTGIIIENNLSYGNRTNGADGGGFGLDRNVSDSVLQYNLSYDNDGSGLLLYGASETRGHGRNTARFNVSSNDSRRGDFHGGISVLGGLTGPGQPGGIVGDQIYHNTVVMGAGTDGAAPPVIRIGGTLDEVMVRNNIFLSQGGGPLLLAVNSTDNGATFEGNNYFGTSENSRIIWAGAEFESLSGWRYATGQEIVSGEAAGSQADPELVDPASPTTVAAADQITSASGFALRPGSPMIGAAAPLAGIDPGTRDYFGVPLMPDRVDAGASRFADQ